MKDTSINRSFGFPIPSLYGEAQRLLPALQDATIATPVIARLSPTFVADFEARIALVAQQGTDQSGAMGTVNALKYSKAETAVAYRHIAAFARRCPVLAFPGQDPLLHSEFSVGIHEPRGRAGRGLNHCDWRRKGRSKKTWRGLVAPSFPGW
jgi:hypothetical protein